MGITFLYGDGVRRLCKILIYLGTSEPQRSSYFVSRKQISASKTSWDLICTFTGSATAKAIEVMCPNCVYISETARGSQKVPRILWHRLFGAPWIRTAWTELLVTSTCKFAEETARQVAGRDSGFCTEQHITQPPQSPDPAPNGFWLFPTLKIGLKGTYFATMEDIISNVAAKLQKVP
jgi:hypothetical protein